MNSFWSTHDRSILSRRLFCDDGVACVSIRVILGGSMRNFWRILPLLIALWVLYAFTPGCTSAPLSVPPQASAPGAAPAPVSHPVNTLVNKAGLDLIEYYEGLYLHAYKDSVGIWSICYGRIDYPDGRRVASVDTATKEECESWLLLDLEEEGAQYVRKLAPQDLNENEWAALVSFTYNRGVGRLKKLLALGATHQQIADNLLQFDYAGTEDNHLLGLKRRRRSERALFLGQAWEQFKEWK